MNTNSGSQSSVGIGVALGATVVLLVVVGVLGVGLFCVWRRRHTSQMMLLATATKEDVDLLYDSYAL